MSILESLFSELASQFVPGSIYAPKAPVLKTMEDHQLRASTQSGYVRPIWEEVVNNEEVTEFLIVADGLLQYAETLVDSVVTGSHSMSGATLVGTATTLSAAAAKGATSISVTSAAGIAVGDYIVLDVTGTNVQKKELIKVDSIDGTTLEIGTTKPEGLMVAHDADEAVQVVTIVSNTGYSINEVDGEITINSGAFAEGDLVYITYTSVNSSFMQYNVYRSATSAFADAVVVGTSTAKNVVAIDIGHTGQEDEGQTFYYWVTAIDNEGNESRPAKVENATCKSGKFDTIPTRPLDVHSTVSLGKVSLFWDGTTAGNANLDGYEVYRLETLTNFDIDAQKLGTGFVADVQGGTVAYEDSSVATGHTYYYKVVATDDDSTNTSGSTRQGNVTAALETRTIKNVN